MVGGIVFFVNQWIRFVKNMKCLHRYHKIVKEIYKSQVYYVKNKTFINFALKKGDKHGYSKTDKGKNAIDPCWGCFYY